MTGKSCLSFSELPYFPFHFDLNFCRNSRVVLPAFPLPHKDRAFNNDVGNELTNNRIVIANNSRLL